MTCNTPKTLQQICIHHLAEMLLCSAVPLHLLQCSLKKNRGTYANFDRHFIRDSACGQQCANFNGLEGDEEDEGINLDDIMLAEEGVVDGHLLSDKKLLMDRLIGVKQWWDQEDWLGTQNSQLRKGVREVCSELLQIADPQLVNFECPFPLLRLTLSLLFSTQAGKEGTGKIIGLHKCKIFLEVLHLIKPFGIEKLFTNTVRFWSAAVYADICRYSPQLRFLHLKMRLAKEDVLREIGKVAPNIETIVVLVREYEASKMATSTVEIKIQEGEGLEENLYKGFFDGLSKTEVIRKIYADETVNLTFHKLKNIDVGSHRDVREFLHHLLYLYPDIRSVSCDGEGWELSKYSLDYPVVTHITLVHKPASLHGKTTLYNLREITFTFFCFSIKTQNIIGQYRKLEHINLNLIRGPPDSKPQGDTAKEILSQYRCRCLTVSFDIYMGNQDILSLYIPALGAVGPSLVILQFHLTNEVNVGVLCKLINLCPHLEEFALVTSCERCEVEGENEKEIECKKMTFLKSLGISSKYNVNKALYSLTQLLLLCSPNLQTLELEFGDYNASKWMLQVAAEGLLQKLKTLRINFLNMATNDEAINAFFPSLFTEMPCLTCLMLGSICDCALRKLRSKYRWSQIRILARPSPYVCFRNLSTRCC